MVFDEQAVLDVVREFCRRRRVDAGVRIRVVSNLDAAFDVVALKGPDNRWRSIVARPCGDDFPRSHSDYAMAPAERAAYDHAFRQYDHRNFSCLTKRGRPWWLSHVVVSATQWAQRSELIQAARNDGLGWMVPANKDLLVVPRPTLRCLEDQPGVLHDDDGRMAVEWSDGTGFHFLRGTAFGARLYGRLMSGQLSVDHVAALDDVDQRSIALTYLTFEQLVTKSDARLLNIGAKGTRLYRLRLPTAIARDRVRGYGMYDYFIHMRDASHPEREFIEWVDPKVGVLGDAERCQAHAFGITIDEWMSIEYEG
ncbi:MAG: hypothetical protein U0Q47_09435 [Mycobacterium sp.]